MFKVIGLSRPGSKAVGFLANFHICLILCAWDAIFRGNVTDLMSFVIIIVTTVVVHVCALPPPIGGKERADHHRSRIVTGGRSYSQRG